MSIWPFSNRRGAKTPQPHPAPSPGHHGNTNASAPPTDHGVVVARRLSKRKSTRRRRSPTAKPPLTPHHESSAKEPKDALALALAPPLQPIKPTSPMDTTFVDRRPSSSGSSGAEDITALPNSRTLRTSPHLRPVTQDTADIPDTWNLRTSSHHSLPSTQPPSGKQQRGKLQRNPSRNKRAAYDSPLARRRSSKKRKDDHVREEEIRAMSQPMQIPKRGAAGDTGMLRRESKKQRGSLNRNFERPVSTISLPLEDSIHSSMSDGSDQRRYRLSVLNMISPRPTIRFANATRTFSNNNTESTNLVRKASQRIEEEQRRRKTLHKRQPSKEKELNRMRIDSLADELDSTELRDILDRDHRRRKKREEKEAERLRRRLERKAEKQRAKTWAAEGGGDDARSDHNTIVPTSGDGNMEEHKIDTVEEKDGMIIEEPTFHMEAEQTEDPFSDAQETQDLQVKTTTQTTEMEVIPQMPLMSPQGDEGERELASTPFSEMETPIEETARVVTYASPPMTPISPITAAVYHGDSHKASQVLGTEVPEGRYAKPVNALEDAAAAKEAPVRQHLGRRKDRSDTESPEPKKSGGILASLFRRRRRSSTEPKNTPSPEPSFSNTSREEMSRNIPSHLVAPALVTSAPRAAGTPMRTMSKFREDLPESPLSPPDSRVQSPVEPGSGVGLKATTSRRSYKVPSTIHDDASSDHRVGSPDAETREQSPLPHRASAIMSHSLASVDSEASWLSGGKRRNTQSKKHSSIGGGSLTRREDFNASYEELEVPDDEYFRRLNTPLRNTEGVSGLSNALATSSTTAIGSNPDETGNSFRRRGQEGQIVSHAGASRQPTLIHREQRVKSSEGLLKQYLDADIDDTTPEAEYPTPLDTPIEEEEPPVPVQRATSVNLGGRGHARNVSAGSAKLLDIKGRSGSTSSGPSTPKNSKFSLPLSKDGEGPLHE